MGEECLANLNPASQLHVMVKWYKHDDDMHLQAKNHIFLTGAWRPVIVEI
jgi:hypothetical protein